MKDVDYATAYEFLPLIFAGTEHAVELRSFANEGNSAPTTRFTRDQQIIDDFCVRHDVTGRGTFFACATRRRGVHNGRRENLAELPMLWVEIDCYKFGVTKAEVVAALKSCPIPPSVIIDSGGGIHAYWLFREPLDCRLPDDGSPDVVKTDVESALRQLAGVFAGDIASIDITRVMRLPGTHNSKTGELRPVFVIEASWTRCEFSDLVEMLDTLRPLLRAPGAPPNKARRPNNAFSQFAERYSFRAPLDVSARLAAMTYLGTGEACIHLTQLQVSASLVSQGQLADDQIAELLVMATTYAAGSDGASWNWKRERIAIDRMIAGARLKFPRREPPKPDADANADAEIAGATAANPAPPRQPAPVIQLRSRQQAETAPVEVVQLSGFPLNDLGNASRMLAQHGSLLRYVVGIGWHVWDGRRYRVDPELIAARSLCHETARTMLLQAFDMPPGKPRDAVTKFAIQTGNSNRVLGMLSQAEPHLAAEADDLDRNPRLLNCHNGTLDLSSGDLRPHSRDDLLTKICGTDFDPNAGCPIWERFLLEIFDGSESVVSFVQRAVGYSLTGLTTEQVVFILHGSGSNGKSVLIEIIAAVLCDYVKRSPSDTWVSKHNNGPTNDIAALAGARLVSVVETEHDKQLAEALVKQATGGDAMTARFHYREFFSFIPQFKLWFATNHKPRIRGSDFAIWRRIMLLPFAVTFNDADKLVEGQKLKDPDLKNKLLAELPGILAWMVRGYSDWARVGLQPPAEIIDATENYQDSQDNVSAFIRDNCHVSRGLTCSVALLYASYELWCADNQEEAAAKRGFGKNLDDRGYPSGPRKTRERWRKGIDLKQECRELAEQRLAGGKNE